MNLTPRSQDLNSSWFLVFDHCGVHDAYYVFGQISDPPDMGFHVAGGQSCQALRYLNAACCLFQCWGSTNGERLDRL